MRCLIIYLYRRRKLRYLEDVSDLMLSARDLSPSDVETLTIRAIQTHRRLMKRAESLFQDLPEEYQTGESRGGDRHLAYVEAELEMFTQAETVNRLVDLLGHIPDVPEDGELTRH